MQLQVQQRGYKEAVQGGQLLEAVASDAPLRQQRPEMRSVLQPCPCLGMLQVGHWSCRTDSSLESWNFYCVKPVCHVQTAAEREASSNVDKLGQQLQSVKSELGSIKQELRQAQSSGTFLKNIWATAASAWAL